MDSDEALSELYDVICLAGSQSVEVEGAAAFGATRVAARATWRTGPARDATVAARHRESAADYW